MKNIGLEIVINIKEKPVKKLVKYRDKLKNLGL